MEANGFVGGICALWDSYVWHVNVLAVGTQFIYMRIYSPVGMFVVQFGLVLKEIPTESNQSVGEKYHPIGFIFAA